MAAATSAMPECRCECSRPSAADPVDPAGVGPAVPAAVDDLGLGEQVEHEALVRGAALDHDGGLEHRPAQPGQRLLAGARRRR